MDSENKPRRKYELKQRADEMAATRRRITEAAVELHTSIGPARTTVSAVAERAGVQRHTVYRHFPTDADLFAACSARYSTSHPIPSPDSWRSIGDPEQRLRRALDDLYTYYERTQLMFTAVLRDAEISEDIRATLAPFRQYLTDVVEILATGLPTRGRRRRVLVNAALRHAIDFQTWRSLTGEGRLTRAEAVELATTFATSGAAQRPKEGD